MRTLLGDDREAGSDLPLARQLRFDAGCAALNLLATRGLRRTAEPVERLDTPNRLADWLDANGLPAVRAGRAELAAVHGLREAAYRLLAATVAGTRPARADVRAVADLAARPLPGPALRASGDAVTLRPPQATVETLLTGLARDVAALAADPPPELRACDGPNCGMLYLDTSRGHRRRWCSMGRCGNAAKVAQYRAARAAR